MAAETLEAEQSRAQERREGLVEARGALADLQEQAVLYWNNTSKPENQDTAE